MSAITRALEDSINKKSNEDHDTNVPFVHKDLLLVDKMPSSNNIAQNAPLKKNLPIKPIPYLTNIPLLLHPTHSSNPSSQPPLSSNQPLTLALHPTNQSPKASCHCLSTSPTFSFNSCVK